MSSVFDLVKGYDNNQTLHAASELRLFDIIISECGGSVALATLGEKVGCEGSTDRLERLCNLCCSLGLLLRSETDGNVQYSNSADSEKYLVRSSPLSQHAFLHWQRYDLWNILSHESIMKAVKTGKALCAGAEFFKQFKKEEFFVGFSSFMDNWAMTLSEDLKSLDLGKYKRAVDLGGSLGAVARCVKQMHPDMKVTLADLKDPTAYAPNFHLNKGVDLEYMTVDFLKGDLPPADLYIVAHVLHDWDDEHCLAILNNIREALPTGGAILILDCLLNDQRTGPRKACELDLHMLTLVDGKERTAGEFTQLLTKSGFHKANGHHLPTNPLYDALFAYKA